MIKRFLHVFVLLLFADVVHAQLLANFTMSGNTGCAPFYVNFTNTSTGSPTAYSWNFGNGQTSTQLNPTAVFTTPGAYTVSLTVYNGSGSNNTTQSIDVYAKPRVNFTGTPSSPCAPASVSFTGSLISGAGSISQWNWDFGDGTTSTQTSPTHTYATAGSYNVVLAVRDNNCTGDTTKVNFVNLVSGQNVNFGSANRFSCKPPFTVNYYDSTTPSIIGYTYLWSFGDGTTSTQQNPVKTYTTAGWFDVTLQVTDLSGCIKTLIKKGYIYIPGPHADFTKPSQQLCAPFSITFINQTTPDTSIATYLWSGGNSQTSNQKNPNFTYNSAGNYTVRLITTVSGCRDTMTKTNYLNVNLKPATGFYADTTNYCMEGALVDFTDTSLNATSRIWNMGNGMNLTTQFPTDIPYATYSNYDVRLITQNDSGCVDTLIKTAYIKVAQGVISDPVTVAQGCAPVGFAFFPVDTNFYPFTYWEWQLPDSQFAYQQNYGQFYSDTGVYNLTLLASNNYGCADTLNYTVKVGAIPNPYFQYAPNPVCFSDSPVIFINTTIDSLPTPDNYIWEFSDGDSSFTANGAHIFADTGLYTVTLNAIQNGCMGTFYKDTLLHVTGVVARFSHSQQACVYDSVSFVSQAIGGNKYFWNFGDGGTSTLKNPKHKYAMGGNYTVQFTVMDTTRGCQHSISKSITAYEPIIVAFSANQTQGCPRFTANFSDNSGGYISGINYKYLWTFGNSQTSTIKSPTAVYTNVGNYSVTLSITDTNNCNYYQTYVDMINVGNQVADFTVSNTIGCLPFDMLATDLTATAFPVSSRKWFWGDGDSTSTSPVIDYQAHTYQTLPTNRDSGYNIRLVVTDTSGCKYEYIKNIIITKPVAAFSYTIGKSCLLDTVHVKADTIKINYLRFEWLVDGVLKDSSTTAKLLLSGDTTNKIMMRVYDDNNCTDTVSQYVKILARNPKAAFYASPISLNCPGTQIPFFDTTIAGGTKIAARSWRFGDGGISFAVNPGRIYTYPGQYSVSLKVTDSLGCVDSIYKTNYITIAGPTASYNVTNVKGCTPLTVTFSAIANNTNKIKWNFGDGTFDSSSFILAKIYTQPGIFVPTFTISDTTINCTLVVPATDTITVYQTPVAKFNYSPDTVFCRLDTVLFTGTSTHTKPITRWKWEFGINNDTSALPGPINKIYNIGGWFKVALTVWDSLGCSNTKTRDSLIHVYNDATPPIPSAIYSASVDDNSTAYILFEKSNDADFLKYEVQYDFDATNQPLQQITITNPNTTSFYQNGLTTLDSIYKFRVKTFDYCLNADSSAIRNTINITAQPAPNAIKITWSQPLNVASIDSFILYRALNYDTSQATFLTVITNAVPQFVDTNVQCNQPYFYRVRAMNNQGYSQWSDTAGAVSDYVPTFMVPQLYYATVLDDTFNLVTWSPRQHNNPFTYSVYRTLEADSSLGIFSSLIDSFETISDTFFVDTKVLVDSFSYAYRVSMKDACGATSGKSNSGKTILLNAYFEQQNGDVFASKLNWTAYQQWNSGVERYDVQYFYDTLNSFEVIQTTTAARNYTHQVTDKTKSENCYKVTAYQKDSNFMSSESNKACVTPEITLFAPTAVTANGDGLNEFFGLKGLLVKEFHLEIYSRYGEKIFETNDFTQLWDGYVNGEPAQSGMYTYFAKGRTDKGYEKKLKGSFVLLR